MKRSVFFGFLLLGIAWSCTVRAEAIESIERFDDTVVINPDASFTVRERILYDFGTSEHHGIYRDIPTQYASDIGNKSITLSDIQVTDESGAAYPFSITHSGANERIRIGDANAFVSGLHTYVISYTVSRAISYFSQYDELYWNVTGNGWQIPINEASLTVQIPGGQYTQAACYEGSLGSTEPCAQNPVSSASQAPQFTTTRSMGPGEGLTVAVGFPKGIVRQPSAWENALDFLKDNLVFLLPVLAFFGMLGQWYRRGRDPRGRGTIVAEYEAPDGLLPLQIAAVMHEGTIPNTATSAEIIYLATQGYLKITRTEKKVLLFTGAEYTLTRLKPTDESLSPFDATVLSGLFKQGDEVELSSLRNQFYTTLAEAGTQATQSAVAKGYFATNPASVRKEYMAAGAAVFVLGFLCINFGKAALGLSCIGSALIVMLFGKIMPRVTAEGAIMRERIKGLKEYLEVAEQARIEFHNAPEKNPERFEELLPYAMVLGVEKEWAEQFKDIYTQPPAWYSAPYGSPFNAVVFTDSLSGFRSNADMVLASAPGGGSGSGGGGSSGGGFGGGGGGSW